MYRHHSRAGLVRGKVVDARRPGEVIDDFLEKPGRIIATKLVWVRNDRDNWRAFTWFCRVHALEWKVPMKAAPVEERWTVDGKTEKDSGMVRPVGYTAVIEVRGDEAGMRELLGCTFIKKWEDCLDVGAPTFRYRRR